jgi:hypothetical protein
MRGSAPGFNIDRALTGMNGDGEDASRGQEAAEYPP